MLRVVSLIAATAITVDIGVNASPHISNFRRRAPAEIEGYEFAGCYTDKTFSRGLTGSAYFDDSLTVEKCATACTTFKYFSLEYGRECYCGNTLVGESVETDVSECSFPCPGNSSQNCGAGDRMDVYVRSSDTTPTTSPTSPTPTPTPTPASHTYRGCYAEPLNGRALTGQRLATSEMTITKCATFCDEAGFTHFGLEYYTECYCGNNIAPANVQTAPEADCKYPCGGNQDEICGGDWRLSLYELTSTPPPTTGPVNYVSEGCYTDATSSRTLGDAVFYDDHMTIEKCALVSVGYAYFGLEYGRECFAGNTINTGSEPTELSECSFPCPGNALQKCGAGDRLNLYRRGLPTPSSTSSSSSLVPTTTSSLVSTTSSVVSTTSSVVSTTSSVVSTSSSSSSQSSSTSTTSETSSSSSSTSQTLTSSSQTSSPSQSSSTTTPLETSSSSSTSQTTPSTSVSEPSSSTSSSTTTESHTSTSSLSTTVLTTTTSSSTTTSSTTTTSTTTAAPVPTNVLLNGDFESSGAWVVKTTSTLITYNLANPNGPHGGERAASISYGQVGTAPQAWFNQPITLIPGRRYNFSAWTRASTLNPGCTIHFYFSNSATPSTVIKNFTVTTAQLKTTWEQVTGFIDAAANIDYLINVRTTCGSVYNKSFFVDDISVTLAD